MRNARPGRSLGAGIGLVLSLVVMLIVMAMYFGTFGGKSYMQNVASARKQAIQTVQDINTQQLNTCIAAFKIQHNRLPQTAEELDVGPALLDPWKKPMTFSYQTHREGAHESTTVIWRSAGPDGVMDTPDDIVKHDKLVL
jgi:Na+-transporting methylmalonyl-CoA/oxaloacetate decarboxylase gamma subunit